MICKTDSSVAVYIWSQSISALFEEHKQVHLLVPVPIIRKYLAHSLSLGQIEKNRVMPNRHAATTDVTEVTNPNLDI